MVVGRKHGTEGNPIGMRHSNPNLNTWEYQVKFSDALTATAYAANVIAEDLYSQEDKDGRHFAILQEITNHNWDGTVKQGRRFYRDPSRAALSLVVDKESLERRWHGLKSIKGREKIGPC